jgi:hypothetical protein
MDGFTITGGSTEHGGGINGAGTSATISRCIIRNNRASQNGGGLNGVDGTIEGCTITENTAGSRGGGMVHCHGTIANCLIYNNIAFDNSAMTNCDGDIINCTITNNASSMSPGGLRNCDGSIINCIIWGNYPDQLLRCSEPSYSCIQDWAGGGICNISTDPEFVDANCTMGLEGMSMDAYWTFNQDPNDSSPNGHDGILIGDAGFVQDPDRGDVLKLDGDGDCIEVAGYKGITGKYPRSVSAWIKTDMTSVGEIISWGSKVSGARWLLMLRKDYGTLRLEVVNGSVNGTTVINDGKWHHVAAVWEEDYGDYVKDVRLYVDGQLEATTGSTRMIDTGNDADVMIGCSTGSERFFDGLMDEFAIWDRALSVAQIRILYEKGLRGIGYLRVEGDFHLTESSPCIDAGDPNYTAEPDASDIDGNSRIINGIVDMGVYEFGSANTRPVADAGWDQVVYACADGIAEVKLDGSGSYDDDGDELEYFWFEGNDQIATGVDPNVLLPVGQHTIELIVNDDQEDSEPNDVVITVIGPVEADADIVPRVISRSSRMRRVIAVVRLPEGISKSDIADEPFMLDPPGLEPNWQRILGSSNRATVFAIFDKTELMDALPGNGRVELTLTGKLTTGQCIVGRGTVRVIQPPQQHRRRR